ncbi:Hypothetical_protein [Hexamita inflata]|uniref:Hypothetical_protein n=1 Tax=Hexamita inflata TaxID=28002 RepID=A0AA86RBF1_9EUKA|nr:Hypothetical protein HINF_LOCUS60732 [Hexamita inflata]
MVHSKHVQKGSILIIVLNSTDQFNIKMRHWAQSCQIKRQKFQNQIVSCTQRKLFQCQSRVLPQILENSVDSFQHNIKPLRLNMCCLMQRELWVLLKLQLINVSGKNNSNKKQTELCSQWIIVTAKMNRCLNKTLTNISV